MLSLYLTKSTTNTYSNTYLPFTNLYTLIKLINYIINNNNIFNTYLNLRRECQNYNKLMQFWWKLHFKISIKCNWYIHLIPIKVSYGNVEANNINSGIYFCKLLTDKAKH